MVGPRVVESEAYETEWVRGTVIEAHADSLTGFKHSEVPDTNGNDRFSLDPLPVDTHYSVQLSSMDHCTDADIDALMWVRGITRQEIIDQAAAVLSINSTYSDELAQFTPLVENGLYKAASLAVADTPASISYQCFDPGENPALVNWFFGALSSMKCGTTNPIAQATITRRISFEAQSAAAGLIVHKPTIALSSECQSPAESGVCYGQHGAFGDVAFSRSGDNWEIIDVGAIDAGTDHGGIVLLASLGHGRE